MAKQKKEDAGILAEMSEFKDITTDLLNSGVSEIELIKVILKLKGK